MFLHSKSTPIASALMVLAGFLWFGCSGASAGSGEAARPEGGTVRMRVTEKGFEPNRVEVEKGKPLELVITRETDQTCAKEIVIDEHEIHTELPLDTPVKVALTPTKSGELKYGCAMDKMIGGVLFVK